MKYLIVFLVALAVSGCNQGVSHNNLYPILDEMENQAGMAGPAFTLMDKMEEVAALPDRAELARRRCGLTWATAGAAEKTLVLCQQAAHLGNKVGGEQRHKNYQRLALFLAASGRGGEAEQISYSLLMPKDDLAAGLLWWARGLALKAQGKNYLGPMLSAHRAIEKAAQRNPKVSEFLAIADLRVGEALTSAGKYPEARASLQKALIRQRALDADNPEYAEYRLYLVRILTALGRLPGEEATMEEANRLREELQRRDPMRAEYSE
jgi:tetratricopeptide (TPR) repeat protein